MNEKLFLYYTSDLHSHFENWAQIVGYIHKQKKKHERKGEDFWVVDNGDHMDRVHPMAEGLRGKGNVELLNEAGYDVATLGNNEGITLSPDDLYTLYDDAQFGITCANLQMENGHDPEWLQPYRIVTSARGTKIGFIGLTAPFKTFYEQIGWKVTPPFEVLDRWVSDVKEQVDILVVLSHLGINDDEEIARLYKDVDIIIGGHTHHLFQNGEYIENSLLTAAGKHGTHVGEVMMEWDPEQKRLVKKEAYAIPTEHMEKSKEVSQSIQEKTEKATQLLNQPVTHLENGLRVAWFKETPLMSLLTDELRQWTDADMAMLNAGVLLDHLPEGTVTYEDVHRICPHPMNPCKVEIDGDELLEIVRVAHTKKLTEIRLKGLGFRGEIIGKMIFSGLEIVGEQGSDGEFRVRRVLFQGRPIDPDRVYSLATADTFTFGRLFPEIAYAKVKKYYMPELLRDLLAEALIKKGKTV
ncbi:bifunctional metallophosphatase/5'-nucleotidase [Halobacillus fulvus]|nr:bifunctional metallophosphatase/5'-nucleotidase [Halobacillus fulvus]